MFEQAHLLKLIVLFVSYYGASSVTYHISPTLESCPVDRKPCVTLFQFAANSSQYLQSNTTLVLLEGNHTLDTQFTVEGIVAFSIHSGQNVTCVNECMIYLHNISYVQLHSMTFRGCRIEVQAVDNVFIQSNNFTDFNATFDGFRVLQLTLTNAKIVNTQFSGISISSNIISENGILQANHSDVTIQGMTLENCKANFGLAFHNSTVVISHSNFNNNEVNGTEGHFLSRIPSSLGGVLYSDQYCSVIVTNSTFAYNNCYIRSRRYYSTVGGVIVMLSASSMEFKFCNFLNNTGSGDLKGGAIHVRIYSEHVASGTTVYIHGCTFTNNSAFTGGAVYLDCARVKANLDISDSNFTGNTAHGGGGGALSVDTRGNVNISQCIFWSNVDIGRASSLTVNSGSGGAIFCNVHGDLKLVNNNFTNNEAAANGGALALDDIEEVYILGCTFTNNSAFTGGVVYLHCVNAKINLDISDSNFTRNTAHGGRGGAILVDTRGNVNINGCIFWSNVNIMRASSLAVNAGNGGAIFCDIDGDLKLLNNNFTNNEAAANGGAVYVIRCHKVIVHESFFFSNKANDGNGGAMVMECRSRTTSIIPVLITGPYCSISSFIITSCCFHSNQAKTGNGGALALVKVKEVIINTIEFYNNLADNGGALYVMSESSDSHCSCMDSEHINSVITNISECVFYCNKAVRGGAIYMIGSQPIYISTSKNITENLAEYGGAVFSNSGRLYISNEVKMTNNTADRSGGALYLNNSKMICQDGGRITLEMNMAKAKGGGICSSNSSLIINFTVEHPSITSSYIGFLQNHGEEGGGLYLCKGSIIYLINFQVCDHSAINFIKNVATFGSDLFNIPDSTSGDGATHMSDLASQTECFIQVSPPHNVSHSMSFNYAVYFELSQANFESQLNVLKTRFVTCRVNKQPAINEADHLKAISNLQNVNIGSLLLTLCFCRYGIPDCSYSPPPVEAIQNTIGVEVAMVDQFNHAYKAKIKIEVNSTKGTISKEQSIQQTNMSCTKFEFDVYSSLYYQEIIMSPIHVMHPYQYVKETKRKLSLLFQPCKTCPIGFQKFVDNIRGCQCVCDEVLIKHLIGCNYSTQTVTKQHTTAWISHYSININSSGYLIYPHCPYNYCLPPETRVEIDLNIPSGHNAQCNKNRGGLLCGACINGSTLSIGKTLCIECDTHWPVVLLVLIISGIVGGIILVAFLLVLNLTVAVGTLNGIIFYANIVTTNSNTFFPTNKFLTVFISWINLEVGIDTCFFEGMDAYWKTWIELALPTYLIALVIIIIIFSEKSMRFSNLIGKKNPVATLDTLVLLSYVKFLRVIISSYSFAILDYPDQSHQLVWLPDATVPYFSGKHIPLFIAATLVLLVGVAYTSLLLFWQWLLRYQDMKCLAWIRNQHLRLFIVPYHAPYKPKHRYWTGLLLLVRILVYIISAVTLSLDPTINIVAIGIAASILLLLSINRPYNKGPVELLEVISLTNMVCFCIATLYFSKAGSQDTVGFISGSVTLLLFLIVLGCHVLTEICFKTKHGRSLKQKFERKFNITDNYEDSEEVCVEEARMPITYSEVPAPRGDSNCTEGKGEVRHTKRANAFEMKMQSSPNNPVPYRLMQ